MALSPRILVAGVGLLAAAAAEPSAREPIGPWNVDFADAQCVASRPYGSADKPLFLALKAPPVGEVIQIAVMRKGGSGSPEQVDATIGADERRPLKTNMLMFTPKGAQMRVYVLNMPSGDFSQVSTAKSLTIRSTGLTETFSLSQIAPLMRIMDKCVADLRKVWNVSDSLGEQSSLAKRAQGDFASIFRAEDYPAAAIYREQTGRVRFAALIDERGRVADCTVIETSGVASLDVQTCSVVKDRARFAPALSHDGKPAKDAAVQTATWRIER
jgi:TonB family protein